MMGAVNTTPAVTAAPALPVTWAMARKPLSFPRMSEPKITQPNSTTSGLTPGVIPALAAE